MSKDSMFTNRDICFEERMFHVTYVTKRVFHETHVPRFQVGFTLSTGHKELQRKLRYSPTLFLDLGTRRSEGPASHPDHFLPPGKTRYPLYRKLGGLQGCSGQCGNSPPPGFDPWTVQPIASRYTD
jgi:hypothetical protein